jgi:hypothetical protein
MQIGKIAECYYGKSRQCGMECHIYADLVECHYTEKRYAECVS